MPARRCSLCGVSYPSLMNFSTCPVHGEPTDYLSNVDPDDDWQKTMERLRAQVERDAALHAVVPLVPGVKVIEEGDLLFVDQSELMRAGCRLSRMVPNTFHLFELEDGWIYETQGWDEPRRRWWVERVIRSQEEEASPTTLPEPETSGFNDSTA